MVKFQTEDLRTALEEVIKVLGLQDEKTGEDIVLPEDMPPKALDKMMTEAVEQVDLKQDKFTKLTTRIVMEFMDKASKTKAANAIHERNIASKPVTVKADEPKEEPEDADEDNDDDEEGEPEEDTLTKAKDPVKKPTAKKPTAPKTPVEKVAKEPAEEKYTRIHALVEIIKKNPKLKAADVASAADKLYVSKTGGKSNIRQTRRRYLLVIKVYELLKA